MWTCSDCSARNWDEVSTCRKCGASISAAQSNLIEKKKIELAGKPIPPGLRPHPYRQVILGHWKRDDCFNGTEKINWNGENGTLFHFTDKYFRHIVTEVRYRYHLYPEEAPRAIDLIFRPFVLRGIYELQGDRLRLRFGTPNKPRPSSFDTHEDTRTTQPTEVFHRSRRKAEYKRKPEPDILVPGAFMPKLVKRSAWTTLQQAHKKPPRE